jgi:hypothetical protein
MCEYASFVYMLADGRILAGNLHSHEGIEQGWNLAPDTYRECEWTAEGDESLAVRGETEFEAEDIRQRILRRYPTRSALLAVITEGRTEDCVLHFEGGELHCEDGPAVVYPNGRQEWYWHGKLHREGGPAVVYPNGTRLWYSYGKGMWVDWPSGT